MKVTVKKKKDPCVPNIDTCIRCVCATFEDIIKLNEIIDKFNHTKVNKDRQALIQVARIMENNNFIIYLTIMAADESDNKEDFIDFNLWLYNNLSSAKIDFAFVNFDIIPKNVADIMSYTEDKDDNKLLVFDRFTMGKDVFDNICRYIVPNVNVDHIAAIRIPYSEVVVTADCKWNTISNESEVVYKKEECTENNKEYATMTISIFTKEYSKMFDILVKNLRDRCIIETLVDYEDNADDGYYFRTVSIKITTDIIGRSFFTTCANFGVVNYIN